MINGFYFDDSTEYNPDLYPKPSLCFVCKNNEDNSQYIYCNLTRLDQLDEPEFNCDAFENQVDRK